MKKVLIASPVKQKDNILLEFLWALERLSRQAVEVYYAFIDDQDTENRILRQFAEKNGRTTIIRGYLHGEYICNESTHHWHEKIIWKVAAYKDRLLQMAHEYDFDYIFLVDSDLVLHPLTLVHLINCRQNIISEVYWTRWKPSMPLLPQVWMSGQYELSPVQRGKAVSAEEISRLRMDFINMLSVPGTYRVGGLGACTLISREALVRGVSFDEIHNLEFVGEDRHFCVRAAALGLELYADTHYPPVHLYRESELASLHEYKLRNFPDYRPERPRLTVTMTVRNEAGRYLPAVLTQIKKYADTVAIIDDASEDDTVQICRESLQGFPHKILVNSVSEFGTEYILRKRLWEFAGQENPGWILVLDADEILEDEIVFQIDQMLTNPYVDVYCFRLYDMWDETHYREDQYWSAHKVYRPFLVRYQPGMEYAWQQTPQHCGRLPLNTKYMRWANSSVRVKHFGWASPADRITKYFRYKQLDPGWYYGIKEQYLSILDPRPTLLPWN